MIQASRPGLVRLLLAAAVALVWAFPVAGQDPDSVVVADSTVVSDTLEVAPLAEDSITALDSIQMADTIRIYRRLPVLPAGVGGGAAAGAERWHWDRSALLGRPHLTILELLSAELPGVVPLRQGDFGSPEGLVLDGLVGPRVRVFFDGVEEIGLAGSSVDLSRVALVGLESVTVRRVGGELRIELEPLQAEEGRPLSMIEAGTGDLDTNLFRGTFIQGDALGGALGIGIERVDTQGRGANEPGARQGVWLRYMRPFGEHLSIAAEFRRAISEQTIDRGPERVQRHTSILRARWEFSPTLVAEAFAARNSLRETEDSISPIEEGGLQYGARVGWSTASSWVRGELRAFEGDLPSTRLDIDAGLADPRFGSVNAHLSRGSFDGQSTSLRGLVAETRPLLGFSLFAATESGDRGWRGLADTTVVVPPDTTSIPMDSLNAPSDSIGGDLPAGYRVPTAITSRDATRYGVRFAGYGVRASVARLRSETDSVRPVGTFLDGEGVAFASGVAEGWEAALRWELPRLPWMYGFYLDGSLQRWDRPDVYRPEEVYRAGIGFHRTYYDTGNFELWAGVMAEGRSEMMLPFPDMDAVVEDGQPLPPIVVPFQQSWNAWLQFRVVTVRIFVRFENLTLRPRNQDYPGRLLPQTRAMYGVRWTLFN